MESSSTFPWESELSLVPSGEKVQNESTIQAYPRHNVYKIIMRSDLEKLEAAVNAYMVENETADLQGTVSKLANEQFVQVLITYGVPF